MAVGLAVSQMTTLDDDSADDIAQNSVDFAATPAAAGAKPQGSAAIVAATFESEEFDDSESDLDAILCDLAEDTLQVAG